MIKSTLRSVVIVLVGCQIVGCNSDQPEDAAPTKPSVELNVPVELVVKQRTTTAVPGSDGELVLTIDDITRNQVMASLAAADHAVILPARSVSPKESIEFQFGDTSYVLTLKELDNELVGEDLATFAISSPSETALSEETKIERLIAAVAELKDAKFIRNGTEHSASEAAEHLQKKWDAAREEINTAEQFIEAVGSKSSLSGEPYTIQMANGKLVRADEFLRERLTDIKK